MKFICCLFFVICLTACKSSLVTDLAAGPGGTLYHDDFSDPTSGWMRTSGPGGAMDYDNGMYRMVITAQNYNLWSFSGHAYRDVRVEADATRMAGPAENLFGLICRSRVPIISISLSSPATAITPSAKSKTGRSHCSGRR